MVPAKACKEFDSSFFFLSPTYLVSQKENVDVDFQSKWSIIFCVVEKKSWSAACEILREDSS